MVKNGKNGENGGKWESHYRQLRCKGKADIQGGGTPPFRGEELPPNNFFDMRANPEKSADFERWRRRYFAYFFVFFIKKIGYFFSKMMKKTC